MRDFIEQWSNEFIESLGIGLVIFVGYMAFMIFTGGNLLLAIPLYWIFGALIIGLDIGLERLMKRILP